MPHSGRPPSAAISPWHRANPGMLPCGISCRHRDHRRTRSPRRRGRGRLDPRIVPQVPALARGHRRSSPPRRPDGAVLAARHRLPSQVMRFRTPSVRSRPSCRSAAARAAALARAPCPRPAGAPAPLRVPREYSCPLFPASNSLNRDISHAPVDPRSAQYIASIGLSGHLHPDFGTNPSYGIPYTVVGPQPAARRRSRSANSATNPSPGPTRSRRTLPSRVQAKKATGTCSCCSGAAASCMSSTPRTATAAGWEAGSGAVFNLRSNALRPEGWTSADAAGLPIMPLLVRYDEVRAGQIDHALRVTVARTQRGYIHPRPTSPPPTPIRRCRRWDCACACARATASPASTASR